MYTYSFYAPIYFPISWNVIKYMGLMFLHRKYAKLNVLTCLQKSKTTLKMKHKKYLLIKFLKGCN